MRYVDGFLAPVKAGTSADAYADFALKAAPIFLDHGALRVVEGWGDDVPHGKTTDFFRAVAAEGGETVVFSWVEWPDKAARDPGMEKVMADPRMQPSAPAGRVPFDGRRMVYGGFRAVVDEACAPPDLFNRGERA